MLDSLTSEIRIPYKVCSGLSIYIILCNCFKKQKWIRLGERASHGGSDRIGIIPGFGSNEYQLTWFCEPT